MSQGREGVSLADRAAPRCRAVVHRLSLLALAIPIAAFLAATAGTSYAKGLKDKVVVSNFGVLFAGSIETFGVGSIKNTFPTLEVVGSNTLLGAGNGAAGDAQSSFDGDIAVTMPLGIAGFCPAGCVDVFPAGANGNTAPEQLLGGPGGTDGTVVVPAGIEVPIPFTFDILLNNSGLFLDQGVSFDNPFIDGGVAKGSASGSTPSVIVEDRFAVTNFGQVVLGTEDEVETADDLCLAAPTVGTITEYISGQSFDSFPTPNFPVFEAQFTPMTPMLVSNATIGGCHTALAGPVGDAFDEFGNLWVVNEGFAALGDHAPPGFVVEFEAGDFGDAAPIDIVGLLGVTTKVAPFINPLFITVGIDPTGKTDDEFIYVTDVGDNTIKVFDVDIPFFDNQIETIHLGPRTAGRPEGIALSPDGFLYVVGNNSNTLVMFDAKTPGTPPKVVVRGPNTDLKFPVGVALPEFPPPVL